MKRIVLGAAIAASCAAGRVASGQTPFSDIEVDKPHPDFLLPKLDGSVGRLSDYHGRKILLIHFASW